MSNLAKRPEPAIAVSILAGGLSTRMGRNKSRVRLGGRTMLGHARRLGKELRLPVRVIRRDLLPRCGPLGGVFTALRTARADVVLFLACDMPFVSAPLLRGVLRRVTARRAAAFTVVDGVAGFPFALRRTCLPIVEKKISAREFSLQSLAKELRAARVSPKPRQLAQTFNVNTPAELAAARERKERRNTASSRLKSAVAV